MNLLEVLNSEITTLPIVQAKDTPFRASLKARLNSFQEIIFESDDLFSKTDDVQFNLKDFRNNISILIEGISKTIDLYFEGKPSEAYRELCDFMDKSSARRCLEKSGYLDKHSNLFRIRKQQGNFPLTKEGMFHIPFECRGLVKTQRYSIPGLPSLYLSNSIYLAWEEMLRPSYDLIQAIKLSPTRRIRYLDLTTDIYNRNSFSKSLNTRELSLKLMIWPLVAACSFKVWSPSDVFKPEYIIPQLLLQWINKIELDGIKYSSTHIDFSKYKHRGYFYNLVLPVKTFDSEKGHCPILTASFEVTESLPMQLRQLSATNDRFHDQASINYNVNNDVQEIEIIKGKLQPYARTAFGVLEHALRDMESARI